MREPQGFGVQRLSGKDLEAVLNELVVLAAGQAFYNLSPTIGLVSKQGVTDVLHMHPNLVRPPRLQLTLDKGYWS